jgi:hypothetical protein
MQQSSVGDLIMKQKCLVFLSLYQYKNLSIPSVNCSRESLFSEIPQIPFKQAVSVVSRTGPPTDHTDHLQPASKLSTGTSLSGVGDGSPSGQAPMLMMAADGHQ